MVIYLKTVIYIVKNVIDSDSTESRDYEYYNKFKNNLDFIFEIHSKI